ncbi:hypothetical protein RRG08_034244 [Elysia crispata]|uniref:Uncharacterized protein n=1 Tax=Elysia crispata TaxID=231223 RepID=A0AAE1A0G2_9GAST|nr:hypothetical protein RRG08_034244 [Elysia crispata]
MFVLVLLVLAETVAAFDMPTCSGEPSKLCSCNFTSGDMASGQVNSEDVDWRVVILAGLTGALGSSLVVIGVTLVAVWKASQKIKPNIGSDRSFDPRRPRPISNTSSSSESWAEPRRRVDPIDNPQEWPEKLRFTGSDQPSPRWSHGNSRVWPGAKSNLSNF